MTRQSQILTEAMLRAAAGERSFGRGGGYVRYVRGLNTSGSNAQASIQAKNMYLVEVDWSEAELRGRCTCPNAGDGNFCKHQVAVGLAVLDRSGRNESPEPSSRPVLDEYLEQMDEDSLRELVEELAARDPGVLRLLEVRAAVRRGGVSEAAADDLVSQVNAALRIRGFVDYRHSYDVAQNAQEALDELEGHLDAGAADLVRPALLRAMTRLQRIAETADDSSGVIGDACQRAADLHARSCREGNPDRKALARWLVKFRDGSPGWPETPLEDYVTAFDDGALATYRRCVHRLDEKFREADEWARSGVDQMLLELADHDGDVDHAVALLQRGKHPLYGAIIDRMRAAGRDVEAIAWMDRAVDAGSVSRHGGGNEYWLAPDEVAETYQALGRVDEALAVRRSDFARRPSAATFGYLVAHAERVGRAETERDWALNHARERAQGQFGNGGVLVEIALRADDLDAAWEAAREFGAGHMWEPLAMVSAERRPLDAASLYRPRIEEDLRHPNTKLYPGIADRLSTIRELHRAAGADDEFATYIQEIRTNYGRRPSLMRELDRRGL